MGLGAWSHCVRIGVEDTNENVILFAAAGFAWENLQRLRFAERFAWWCAWVERQRATGSVLVMRVIVWRVTKNQHRKPKQLVCLMRKCLELLAQVSTEVCGFRFWFAQMSCRLEFVCALASMRLNGVVAKEDERYVFQFYWRWVSSAKFEASTCGDELNDCFASVNWSGEDCLQFASVSIQMWYGTPQTRLTWCVLCFDEVSAYVPSEHWKRRKCLMNVRFTHKFLERGIAMWRNFQNTNLQIFQIFNLPKFSKPSVHIFGEWSAHNLCGAPWSRKISFILYFQ